MEDSRWENWLALGRGLAALSQDDPAYRAWAEHALQQATSLAPEGNQAPAKALAEFQAAQQATNEAQPSPTQVKPAGPDQPTAPRPRPCCRPGRLTRRWCCTRGWFVLTRKIATAAWA